MKSLKVACLRFLPVMTQDLRRVNSIIGLQKMNESIRIGSCRREMAPYAVGLILKGIGIGEAA